MEELSHLETTPLCIMPQILLQFSSEWKFMVCFNTVRLEISVETMQDVSEKYSPVYMNKPWDLNWRRWACFFKHFYFFSSVCRNARVQCTSVKLRTKSKWYSINSNKIKPITWHPTPKLTLSIGILHIFVLFLCLLFLFVWNIDTFSLCSVFTETLLFVRGDIPWDFCLGAFTPISFDFSWFI